MPIRRIEGATPAPVKKVNGKDVTLWNHGTIADGINLTVKTLIPICDAINEGSVDLSAAIDDEKLRAIQAETDLSGWCGSLSSKLDTVSSNLDIVSGNLIDEIVRSTTKDEELQSQIDTIEAATDVIDVFGTYSQFNTEWKTKYFPTGKKPTITDKDIIKIINDEHTPVGDTGNLTTGHQTYYQWTWTATTHTTSADGDWNFIGFTEPYYNTAEIDDIIRNTKTELSSVVSNNYLSAKGAVLTGRNIAITEDANYPKITIATKDDVDFNTVSAATAYGSSAKFTNMSASTLYGPSNNSNVDSLIGSAQSGKFAWNVINSAKFSAIGSTTSTAYLSGDFAIKAGDNLTLTYANKTITLNAGDTGITAISAGNTKYTGPVFSASAGTGINFVNDSNNVLGIKASNSLITSAEGGSAASAWINNTLFDYSYTHSIEPETSSGSIDKITVLYKNDVADHGVMYNQEMVFSRGNYSVSGLLIQAANSNDNGKVLTYNSTANNYTWQPFPPTTYSNADPYISIDNVTRTIGLATTGIKTSAYYAELIDDTVYYNSELNGQSLRFSYGHGSLDISFTGVSYHTQSEHNSTSTNWENLFQNYAQVNRDKISTGNLTADKVNFIVATGSSGTYPYKAVNFVVTSTLPSVLDSDTYYIV